MTNVKYSEKRINYGLDRLKKDYTLIECDTGEFEKFIINGAEFNIRQFEIVGLGNLLIMTNYSQGSMQLDTFVITPYSKNLPLFSTDYMFMNDKRMVLNEIYDVVAYKDDLYNEYLEKFKLNCSKCSNLPDMPSAPAWFDSIRSVFVSKMSMPENDELTFELFRDNLETFIELEKKSPILVEEAVTEKWQQNFDYARRLVEDGGVSTQMFVAALGIEKTREFFYKVFFAPEKYKV